MTTKPLALDWEFAAHFGAFYITWITVETNFDIALGRFLNLSDENANRLTSGLDFGRKAVLLIDLVRRSDHPKKDHIVGLIKRIQKESKRNLFSHSLLDSDQDKITFIERSNYGTYNATEHHFKMTEFADHVYSFIDLGVEFEATLGITLADVEKFTKAALSATAKP